MKLHFNRHLKHLSAAKQIATALALLATLALAESPAANEDKVSKQEVAILQVYSDYT